MTDNLGIGEKDSFLYSEDIEDIIKRANLKRLKIN